MKILPWLVAACLLLPCCHSICDDNCLDCYSAMDVCVACRGDMEPDVLGTCHTNSIDKCVTYSPTGDCLRCQSTYSLAGNLCLKIYSGCAYEGGPEQCFECGFGTSLRESKCVGVLNCAVPEGQCTRCLPGYRLEGQVCRDESKGCAEVNGQNGACVKCKPGHFYSGYRCFEEAYRDEKCYILADQNSCLLCKNGYFRQNGKCISSKQLESRQQNQPTPNIEGNPDTASNSFGSIQDFGFSNSGSGFETSWGSENNPTAAVSQQNKSNPVQTESAAPLTNQISNCEVMNQLGGCLICTYGFYPFNRTCAQVSQLCDGHNVETGDCFACKLGLTLDSGKCLDRNCLQVQSGLCTQCASEFRLAETGVCIYSDSNCLEMAGNRCEKCRPGYYASLEGRCRQLPPFCSIANIQTGECLECIANYSKSSISSPCTRVIVLPPNCEAALADNICTQCVSDFELISGLCYKKIIITNCDVVDLVHQKCAACASKYYADGNTCQQYPPNCNQIKIETKTCSECSSAYVLDPATFQCNLKSSPQPSPSRNQSGGITIISQSGVADPNCRQFSGPVCRTCSNRFYVGPEGRCLPVNPLCREHDAVGNCTGCYLGYSVQAGKCLAAQSVDPNCKRIEGPACAECFQGFYLSALQKLCKRLNPLCRSSNTSTGACLSCYSGYRLSEGACVEGSNSYPNCKKVSDNTCSECFAGYALVQGKCIAVSPLCRAYDKTTAGCTSCYQGYELLGSACVAATARDKNCKKFNTSSPDYCQECYPGFIAAKGKCSLQNPLCKSASPNDGACTSCWQGYRLQGVDCVLEQASAPTPVLSASAITKQPSDPNCIKNAGGACIECGSGYYLTAAEGICRQVDPLCMTSDNRTGGCTSCYMGYSLTTTQKCELSRSIPIPNCLTISSEGICSQCLQGYFAAGGECRAVSILCRGYDRASGLCTGCVSGHVLQEGACVYPAIYDENCVRYDNSYCSLCSNGFYMSNYTCKQIDPACRLFNYFTSTCTQCEGGHLPQGPGCA